MFACPPPVDTASFGVSIIVSYVLGLAPSGEMCHRGVARFPLLTHQELGSC